MKRAQIYETGTNLFENASMGDENAKSTQQNNTYQLIERQNLQERLSMTKKIQAGHATLVIATLY